MNFRERQRRHVLSWIYVAWDCWGARCEEERALHDLIPTEISVWAHFGAWLDNVSTLKVTHYSSVSRNQKSSMIATRRTWLKSGQSWLISPTRRRRGGGWKVQPVTTFLIWTRLNTINTSTYLIILLPCRVNNCEQVKESNHNTSELHIVELGAQSFFQKLFFVSLLFHPPSVTVVRDVVTSGTKNKLGNNEANVVISDEMNVG